MKSSYRLKCGVCTKMFDGSRKQKLRARKRAKVFCTPKCKQLRNAIIAGQNHSKRYRDRLRVKHEEKLLRRLLIERLLPCLRRLSA